MGKVSREKEMNVTVDSLWGVITDFARYPEFVEQVVATRPLPSSGTGTTLVQFELEVVKRFQYVLEFRMTPKQELSWKLVESNFFKKNDGRWLLKDLGGRTHATYEVEVDFPFMVPGWITKKLTEVQLPRMLEAFEARALKVN